MTFNLNCSSYSFWDLNGDTRNLDTLYIILQESDLYKQLFLFNYMQLPTLLQSFSQPDIFMSLQQTFDLIFCTSVSYHWIHIIFLNETTKILCPIEPISIQISWFYVFLWIHSSLLKGDFFALFDKDGNVFFQQKLKNT